LHDYLEDISIKANLFSNPAFHYLSNANQSQLKKSLLDLVVEKKKTVLKGVFINTFD